MDLRRLKTVFIVLLVVANMVMGVILYNADRYAQEEKLAMADNVSEILARKMIFLPEKLELPETPGAKNYYLEKMFGSTKEMIVKFLGNDYAETGQGMYSSSEGSLFVNGDEFIFRRTAVGASDGEFSAEQGEAMCREEMKRLGMMEHAYAFNGFNHIPNGTKAIFTVKHENAEFFDAYVSFDIMDNRIVTIGGKNIISGLEVSESSSIYPDVEGVLVGLAKSEKLKKNVSHSIISVKHGYYIGKSAVSYRNILAIPVWQVALDSGQILHFDARNGQELDE